jgi:hypothetical protein
MIDSISVSLNHVPKKRVKSWLQRFLPFVVALTAVLIFDTTVSILYLVDFAKMLVSQLKLLIDKRREKVFVSPKNLLQTVDGAMKLMEIQNQHEVRPIFQQINQIFFTSGR